MEKNESSTLLRDEGDDDDGESSVEKDSMDCPICLQSCIHPTKLPCGHIFCFLCVKGVAYKNRRCAMCRREIPPEFLDHPQLVHGIQELCKTKATQDGYQWFYEGRNGWWQYDERTSQDLEEAFKKGEKSCTILVAGYVYIVDFEAMLQQRQNDPSRRRHVKRDLATIPKKGVAGLRIEQQQHDELELPFTQLNINTNSTSNIISTIAATDTASRIASDIIGSTLAHADEVIATENHNVRELLENAEELLNATVGANLIPVVDHSASPPTTVSISDDLFSQTLENFRSLTLQNVINSSDSEDDNEQIIL